MATLLSATAQPELRGLTTQLSGLLGSQNAAGQLAPDAAIRNAAAGQLNQSYDQARMGSREAIQYGALRSGLSRTNPMATSGAITSAATSLERDRMTALNNLNFQSAQSSMQDYNQVLQLLGQGTQAELGLATGFSGAATGALSGLSSASGGALGGASMGASLGGSFGPWGALAGGIAGAAIGANNP